MAQIATLLSDAERKSFGARLLERVEKALSEAPTAEDERRIRRAISAALSQPSINRLRAYAEGHHLPTPRLVRSLAAALGFDSLALLREAGYDREVILDLHDLRLASRRSQHPEGARRVIEYAVRLFPRRGERYRERRFYLDALLEYSLSLSVADSAVDHRVPLATPLARAYEILGDASLERDCRRALAGELVRSWTYALDAAFARSIEQSAYVRVPGVGEPAAMPLPPIRPLARVANTRKKR